MNKSFLNYTDWQDTADTLHMYLQVAGKIKLARCEKRPEWAHARLYLTVDGLSTGLIPGNNALFEIFFNFRKHRVELRNGEGVSTMFLMKDGLSVADFYKHMNEALTLIGSPTNINVHPQEFYDPIAFDKDEIHHYYDEKAVLIFLDNLQFAYKAIQKFISPFRGKVNFPAYYFGTMDLSSIVYSGESAPFEKSGAISARAFDERSFECGFWPGDIYFPKPAFYVLPYPFISDIESNEAMLQPDKAVFISNKKEFFLTLEDAFSYPDSTDAVVRFFKSSFEIIQKIRRWEYLDWITKPLKYSE
ncbi:DUF5996 family protein [Coprobacter sp.]